jgi:acetyl esterase/lipase
MPWLFLGLSLVGAALAYNAWRPARRWQLVPLSFVAGWLTGELAPFQLVGQIVIALVLVRLGALGAWPGWLGLAVTVASWLGLVAIQLVSLRSAAAVEDALRGGLGPSYRDRIAPGLAERLARGLPFRPLLFPFWLVDRRVERIRNLPYVDGGRRRHQLDIYRARAGVRGAPVLLQIHGGAWIIGDKAHQGRPLMLHLAAKGWVCVAANYRLSPRATFPDHLVDCKRALAWIRAHIAAYGGDPDFIVVTGGSAGGHLASMVALTANDARYQPGFEDQDTSVAACVSMYGVYDLAGLFEHTPFPRRFADRFERVLMGALRRDEPARFVDASPIAHVDERAPPFFVVHGGNDNLVPVAQARRFADALRAVSTQPVVYAEIAGASHAFEVFHSVRAANVVNGVDRFLAVVQSARAERADDQLFLDNAVAARKL